MKDPPQVTTLKERQAGLFSFVFYIDSRYDVNDDIGRFPA
jgi:hypothetical protein